MPPGGEGVTPGGQYCSIVQMTKSKCISYFSLEDRAEYSPGQAITDTLEKVGNEQSICYYARCAANVSCAAVVGTVPTHSG